MLVSIALTARATGAGHELPEYRYFRALSIDLQGRPPDARELAAFEQPGFDLDRWIDDHLSGPRYAERLRRIYMDSLRLDVSALFGFMPAPVVLRRVKILGADGVPVYVYFRRGQRRRPAAIDGDFCFTHDETGLFFRPQVEPTGDAIPVSAALLAERTVLVKPWWLYADYRSARPTDRLDATWKTRFPGFDPVPELQVEPDGKTPTIEVRVCKEEAQTADSGIVYASGRDKAQRQPDRFTAIPPDTAFAREHHGQSISCLTATGYMNSADCGCGPGLERCVPGAGASADPPAFVIPTNAPLGADLPFETQPRSTAFWWRLWWGEEALHFMQDVFEADRDVRDLLTSHTTWVNGPLAQFYRFIASATCCGHPSFDYLQPDPLTSPSSIPPALLPQDTNTWERVVDRGPHASGLLTMPVFLAKYGSGRARAHALYTTFLCKDFVATDVRLSPSTDPDLTKRPGCSTCHHTLEPMAAYFARVADSDWTYLPREQFPISLPQCGKTKPLGYCKLAYDPAFGLLRGAYSSPAHADAGPEALAQEIASSPEFAPCVVKNVAESFLGRSLRPEDEHWKAGLTETFVHGGYRMKPLVRAIVRSAQYRQSNDVRP